VQELKDNLFLYFVNVQKVELFITIKSGEIEAIDNKGKKVDDLRAFFGKKVISTGLGANIDSLNGEDDDEVSKQAEEITSNQNSSDNDLNLIEENLDKRKIAIFFDEFEWRAGLYTPDRDYSVLKRVRNWDKSKNSFVIVSIKDPEKLEEFDYDIDLNAPNMLYIGNPSQIEIAKTYKRYIGKNREDIKIVEEDFETIVTSIQASKKNLREAIRVLKRVLSNIPKGEELKQKLFEDALSKPIEEKVSFDDVVLDTETKDEIVSIMDTFKNDKQNAQRGFIMYGPSGTGKTFLAKAIANEYNMNYMAPTLADLKGEYIGQTSGKVKRIFEEARANSPTIMFLDEIDTIFPKRGSGDTDSYLKDMVNQFLVEIDGAMSGKQEIFIIGATNRLEVIDSAIMSRLSIQFKIDLPDKESREKMFDNGFKTFKLSQQSWKNDFIKKTEGFSGRDIDAFVKNIKETINSENEITEDIFYLGLNKIENNFKEDFKREIGSIQIETNLQSSFDDVIGYDKVKEALKNELNYILSDQTEKKKMKKFNIKPKRGHLLYGPPGNGKTTFAKALAGENDFYYIRVLSRDFMGYSPSDSLKKIETIFKYTIKLSKMTNKKGIVLFFDEIDTLINKEMDFNVRGTLLSFLEDENGIKSDDSKIILIGATNYKEKLDEASIREGRFDNKLKIDYPTDNEAISMLRQFFEKDEDLDVSSLNDEFYKQLIDELKEEKKQISSVDLQGIKESEKTEAFQNGNIKNGKIKI
jgi:transitional endoplasmic reticulum ATPase